MSHNKRTIVGLLIFVFALVGVIASLELVKQRQEIRKKAAPATTIYFEPASANVSVGQTIDFDILVDTGENALAVVRLDIDFEPTALEALSLVFNEALLPQPLRPIDLSQPGKIDGSAGVAPGTAVSGSSQRVASVSFRAIAEASEGTIISFGPNTVAYSAIPDEPIGSNLISQKDSAVVTINPSGEPTATPTPLPTSTPTPTSVPTATPTPIPTATVTPTSTPGLEDQTLRFSLRFEGVTSRPADESHKQVQIYATSSDGGSNIGSADNKEVVTVSVDDGGVYHGEITLTGNYFGYHYRLRIKGPKHLQAVFRDVVFYPGLELDLTSWPLRPGDLNLDARVDADDLQIINERMFATDAASVALADVNFDQRVDIVDRTLVLNTLSVHYDPD